MLIVRQIGGWVCVLSLGLAVAGCAGSKSSAAAGRGQTQKMLATECSKMEELEKAQHKLQESLNRQVVAHQDLEEKIARLQLQLFEREAQLRDVHERHEQAILEVVRAKAKLRSLESKAEAASTLAEAEVAIKTLKNQIASKDKDVDIQRAEELLRLGAEEFKKENYGGALYLTSQAKMLIKEGQERSITRDKLPLVPGEAAFAILVPLRSVNSAKLREGPGTSMKVVASLEEGTSLTGHSYKGPWVRVRAQDGRVGWVYYNQVDDR
jgi:hypothetical protein